MSLSKRKKKTLAIVLSLVFLLGLCTGLWFFFQYRQDQKLVEVVPVSQISTSYWGDENRTSGMVTSDYIQELYPSNDQVISDIFVQEGDQVAVGDKLLQYDKTKLELDLEAKELGVKEADLKIDTAQKQLKKLQNTHPTSTPKPTSAPRPTKTPVPTASPSPSSVPPATVTLYSRLDLSSVPYAGSGTTEDPYLFLCTKDCIMTSEFLLWLLGAQLSGDPTPLPTQDPEEEDPSSQPPVSSSLPSPFAAVFEVREGNSNFGELISAFKLDGTQLSAGFQLTGMISGSTTIDSVADLFKATPTPTPSADNYDYMGYTAEELKQLIAEKRQEIRTLQLDRRQAKLDLDRAQLALKNSTVLSTVDGVVRTLMDTDTAAAAGQPFLVVSGAQQYYLTGVLSENLLGSVQVGDIISASYWQTGAAYSAQIVSISDYPLDSGSGYYGGSGNPNSSSYEFIAVLDTTDELQNGEYLDVSISVSEEEDTDALYIWKPYLKEDSGGYYVMLVGSDNRLEKQYVLIGKSIYGGEYYEIVSSLSMEDYVAFPGKDATAGSRVCLEGSKEEFLPYGGDPSSALSQPESSSLAPEFYPEAKGEVILE